MVKVCYGVRLDSLIFYSLCLPESQKVATLSKYTYAVRKSLLDAPL